MTEPLQKLLYVDDDDDIAALTMMILQRSCDLEVRHCASGPEALAAFDSFRPQMILLDVMMPGMDGPETLRRLQAEPGFGTTPTVFLTAKAQTHEQAKYRELGAIGVLVKPYDPARLCAQLLEFWRDHAR